MKKVFAILLVLVMVTGLFAVATDVGSDELKLTYLKSSSTRYDVGWFANSSFTTVLETAAFNETDGTTKDVEAYLRTVSNFSDVTCSIYGSFKPLTPESAVAEGKSEKISYKASITNLTGDSISDAASAIESSVGGDEVLLGNMPSRQLVSQTGALKFIFQANSDDIAKAQENVAYSTTVAVTMKSN